MTWTGKGKAWGSGEGGGGGKHKFSASQIQTYRDCPRKWGFDKIEKLPRKANKYAQLGTCVHRHLEQYLKDGTLPKSNSIILKLDGDETYTQNDILEIMLPGLKYLPKPGIAKTEERFVMDLDWLGSMVGFVDFNYHIAATPIVGDHKTTGDLKWALTEEDLKTNVQAIIYSVYAMKKYNIDQAECQWVYYQTKGKHRAKLVKAFMQETTIKPLWDGILQDVADMGKILDSGVGAKDLKYCVETCPKYGGCPYETTCALTGAEKMKGFSAMLSLKERMAARTQKPEPVAEPVIEEKSVEETAAEPAGQAINPPESASPLARLMAIKEKKSAAPEPEKAAPEPVKVVPAKVAPAKVAPAKVAPAKVAPAKADPPTAVEKTIKTLYIDCIPNKDFAEFDAVITPVLDRIREEHGTHYKLIDGLYGGNGALLSEYLEGYLYGVRFGNLVIASASPIVKDVLDVLCKNAEVIVRGF